MLMYLNLNIKPTYSYVASKQRFNFTLNFRSPIYVKSTIGFLHPVSDLALHGKMAFR